ncbi:hypothetical protein HNQ94_000167 [Salirhabdus euzebyi]|uniref:Sigma factor regulator N-terminal n=1 Tax=Salirhabdus euzebyi TaxID=394506 RepID=A0A841PWN4_9BACI|nr:anti-sigma factor [Salirhabdus euzebyi]MBB6451746.1 hypothetical protein [Salirhabdus euzebyi]
MSEDFKEKLKKYAEGTLSEEEQIEIEKELEKMELYHSFMDEQLGEDKYDSDSIDMQKKVVRKGKWRARFHNAFTVIGILFLLGFISTLATNVYYSLGEPSRSEVFRDVIQSTIAVTEPNLQIRGSSTSINWLNMDYTGNLEKKIGGSYEKFGDFEMDFLFGLPSIPDVELEKEETPNFFYPPYAEQFNDDAEWAILENIPEGTVAEAFVSLNKLYPTAEALKLFENKNVDAVWFAVDTGVEGEQEHGFGPTDPIGFPEYPIWHPQDLKITSRTKDKAGLFESVETRSGSYPTIEEFGSAEIRDENFLVTLELIAQYESISNMVYRFSPLNLESRIKYIQENGVHVYGIVVTGPSKELLHLQQEEWVETITIGEVRLWNWYDK